MDKKAKKLLLLFAFMAAAGVHFARAQSVTPSVVNASGGYFTAGGTQLSYSLGEVAIQTFTANSKILTQGVLQPEAINTGIKNQIIPQSSISIYPNPFSSKVWVKIDPPIENGRVIIYSMNGDKVYENNFDPDGFELSVLKPGIYMLFVMYKGNEQVSTFKIVKTN